jgi:hypothetical protein
LHASSISRCEEAYVNRKEMFPMKQWVPILPSVKGTVEWARH